MKNKRTPSRIDFPEGVSLNSIMPILGKVKKAVAKIL